jgi:Zn-finger nucleic acid-binding protein
MVAKDFGAQVDVCEQGCQGIWFDRGELAMLDERNDGVGAALEAALRSKRKNDGRRAPLTCPKCSTAMHCHKHQRAKEVNVDECYKCGSFFLDAGELAEIRDRSMSDAEVAGYRSALVGSIPKYAEARLDLDAKKQRSDAIHAFTRLLVHRYWGGPF